MGKWEQTFLGTDSEHAIHGLPQELRIGSELLAIKSPLLFYTHTGLIVAEEKQYFSWYFSKLRERSMGSLFQEKLQKLEESRCGQDTS